MRAALIVDERRLARWQADVLRRCGDDLEVVLVLSCTNTSPPRRIIRNFVYYLINLLFMRGPWRQRVGLPGDLSGVRTLNFESEYRGRWQVLPATAIAAIEASGAEVCVKFGMDLLADPEHLPLRYGVLSFHHGDPARYRGRPAGFHELVERASHVGVVVQRLSSRIDAGAILASAKSKVFLHSYTATLRQAFANSVPLLKRALDNARAGRTLDLGPPGRNRTLPGNLAAIAFLARLCFRKLRRLAYGALVEKRWNIAFAPVTADHLVASSEPLVLPSTATLKIDPRFVFYADPFPLGRGGAVVAEALNRNNGRGELVAISRDGRSVRKVSTGDKHHSYPFLAVMDGRRYLLPEVAYWSQPVFLALDDDDAVIERISIAGEFLRGLVDPTWIEHEGVHYLFGGHHGSESDNLHLYISTGSAFGPYRPHPASPVVMDPGVARMGGAFIRHAGRLYRPGQDNRYAYGDGLTIMEVTELTPTVYSERFVRRIDLESASGPHTLNLVGDEVVFDLYHDRFSLLAGFRRFRARLKAK